jgi:hypothetical protein
MRRIRKDRRNGVKGWMATGWILFLLGFLLFNPFKTSAQGTFDPCDFTMFYPASMNNAPMRDANETFYEWAYFQILRNGDTEIYFAFNLNASSNTVFRVYLNGVFLGVMENNGTTNGVPYWYWYAQVTQPWQVARVGDVMTITRDGQPFLSGKFRRYIFNWAYVGGYRAHPEIPENFCSQTSGYIYFPNSDYPRRLAVFSYAYTPSPVTRVTVNGPSIFPGAVGPEIADVPITSISTGPSIPLPSNWHRTRAKNNDIRLTEVQYQLLRQGLLSVNVFTESHPQGYSQMPLSVYYINAGGDYEGDGQADFAVFRPADQTWYILYSSNQEFQAVPFGLPTDKLIVGDFEHDGKADITAYQINNPEYPGLGVWKIRNSSDGATNEIQWGLPDDIPLALDIDGNNTSDLAVFRPSNGTWYIQKMGDIIKPRTDKSQSVSRFRTIKWGAAGDKPVAGDFDGDRRDELAVFRPSEGNWYIFDDDDKSYRIVHWGANGDIPIARDFDGDAKADITVYRPSNGTWYILSSMFDQIIIRQFGLSGDIPVPSDFDKDGVSDIAVFRPSDGTWYITRSSDNSFYAAQFGINGDIPAMAYR